MGSEASQHPNTDYGTQSYDASFYIPHDDLGSVDPWGHMIVRNTICIVISRCSNMRFLVFEKQLIISGELYEQQSELHRLFATFRTKSRLFPRPGSTVGTP